MNVPRLSRRFEDALVFAARLHAGDIRKGTSIPYLVHVLGTASLAQIREKFGNAVAEIVRGCTDTDETPKPPWRARKEAYVRHIQDASASIRLVSTSDKLHNARAILSDYRVVGEALWSRFKGGKEGTLWYYRTLVDAFHKAGNTPLVEELDRVVSEVERLEARG